MKTLRHKYIFAIFYTLFLISLTVWFLLKTFFIAERYQVIESTSSPSTVTTSSASSGSDTSSGSEGTVLVSTDTMYEDENIKIQINTVREYDTTIYIADVEVKSVEYLQSAFAENSYGRNIRETTSTIAENNGAILAINGDYYGFRNNGFVVRNGVLYRDTVQSSTTQDLVIYDDGRFEVIDEADSDAQILLDNGVWQIYSFGPGLIQNGELIVDTNSEISGKSMNSNPRTAIGMIEPLHYVFVVSDGRTTESAGLSLYELASVMQEYGCTVAYNLDGGGSSTMVFQGEVVNNPTTNGNTISEREVSDIIYIGS